MQAPAKAKTSKAAKAPLQPSNASAQGQAIEDIYQKKTQLEHILLRPDTYIGSTEKQQQKMWVHDGAGIRLADIDYVPGLYKIFDEILVNAADNKVRDPKMDMLKVDIDEVRRSGATMCREGVGVDCRGTKERREGVLDQWGEALCWSLKVLDDGWPGCRGKGCRGKVNAPTDQQGKLDMRIHSCSGRLARFR